MRNDVRWFWRKIRKCACMSASIIPVVEESCSEHCWLWVGTLDDKGYGRTRTILYGKQEHYAHRVAWALTYQRVAVFEVCHSCDTPACCNPTHLWVGTHRQNIEDAIRKGRFALATHRPPPKKLTARKVRHIKELLHSGTLSMSAIAKRYGVSQPMISQIHHGHTWTHITRL